MWRLFSRILLLSLLQYATKAEKLEACPANKVCTLFVNDACKVDGVKPSTWEMKGYIYEDSSSCDRQEWEGGHYARLDFQPVSLHKWSFVLTHWDRRLDTDKHADKYADGGIDNQHIENIAFDFGDAQFTFPIAHTVIFWWRKSDKDEWQHSQHALTFLNSFQIPSHDFTFMRYSFEIESSEKLIMYFGVQQFAFIKLERDIRPIFNDRSFPEKLSKLSCALSEFNRVCYGSCDEVEITITDLVAKCYSNLWFTSKAALIRDWRAADDIRCRQGSWEATWKGGSPYVLDATYEVQCSVSEPGKMTTLLKLLIAFGCILVLIIIVLIIVFCVCGCICYGKKGYSTATSSSNSTPAATRRPPQSKSTPQQKEDQYQPLA